MLGVSRGGPSVSEIVDSMEVSFDFSVKKSFQLLEITDFEFWNLTYLRREESTCFSCWVETELMLAPTLYTMRLLLNT